MRRGRVAVVLVAVAMVGSAVVFPILGAGDGPIGAVDSDGDEVDTSRVDTSREASAAALKSGGTQVQNGAARVQNEAESAAGNGSDLVTFEESGVAGISADAGASAQAGNETAVEAGVAEGIELVQAQGINVTQEQRAAALEGARSSASQYQTVEAEQVQAATAGAVHGALIQQQSVNVTQIQYAVSGATDGGLSQSQSANATQLQSATWGAAHGALAQSQRVSAEQIRVACRGAAAGAAREAGAKDVGKVAHVQEAAQGSAYGALTQYQSVTAEQRQRITLEHVQHAAAGGASGSLAGSSKAALESEQRVDVRQEQRVDVEQRQRVTIKQIQKAAAGASKGALVQEQEVSVEQTQAAARGAGEGALKRVQSIRLEQRQRVSITQVQEASFGAAKGSISQSQAATVEQIQAAASGSAGGVLVQRQSISVTQIQYAAVGAAEGAVTAGVQRQSISVEQIQAAAFGAGEGAVSQTQLVEVTQVQRLAFGGASGALVQSQSASVVQIRTAARAACRETAHVVQSQQISITQLQALTQEAASEATAYAVREDTDDATQITQHVEVTVTQRIETVDRLEGTAAIDVPDQETGGDRVVVDSVTLSEGGFVAIYDGLAVGAEPNAVIGASAYLDAGTHENVTVELDEPLPESGSIVAVPHHDTNDDGTFQYVDSAGEEDAPYVTGAGAPVIDGASVTVADEPSEANATLSVSDQTGTGETLTIDEANASVPYAVTASYGNGTVRSETFAAGERVTNLSLELEPPIEANTTVDVSVVGEDGTALANGSLEYAVANETNDTNVVDSADEADGALTVVDYNIDVNESAPEDEYVVLENVGNRTLDFSGWTLQDRFAEGVVDGAGYDPLTFPDGFTLEPGEAVTVVTAPGNDTEDTLYWGIETPVWNASGDDVVVLDGDGEVVLEQSIGGDGPEASLSVDDQTGDGETLTVDAASASVPYVLAAEYDGQRVETEPIEANTTVSDERLELEPPIAENTTVNVSVRAAADDAVLANESVEYAVEAPDRAGPTANLTVVDQTGDGETLTVTRANASVEYAITVTDENGTRLATSETFGANETIGPEEFDLEPPLAANSTLEVAVVAAANGTAIETATVEYTVDGPPEGFDVEFTNCTRAEVTASLEAGDRVAASTLFYTSGGIGDTIAEDIVTAGDEIPAPYNGTIVFEIGDERNVTTEDGRVIVEVPDYGTFGTYISGISSPAAAPVGSIDFPNPSETCREEIRPERPSIAVEETTPTENGINVTFGYENPNDAPLAANSQFVEGTTADEPPSGLEPGQHAFTVEWTPESDDERLVWQADLSHFGYEEPLTAATPPAGEIEPSAPATFGVSITGATDSVAQGDPIRVDAAVENVGEGNGTQNVSLAIGDAVVNATEVSLEPGETQSVSLTADTDDLEPGEYPLAVSTANETAETTVTVERPATFAVADVTVPESAQAGDEVTVSATIENVGDREGTQTVTYAIDGEPAAESPVTLAAGQSTTVSFTAQLPSGTSTHTIATDDDEASVTLEAAPAAGAQADGAGETGAGETTADGGTEPPSGPNDSTEPESSQPAGQGAPSGAEQPESPADQQPETPGVNDSPDSAADGTGDPPQGSETDTGPADGGAVETADGGAGGTGDDGSAETADGEAAETTGGDTSGATDGGPTGPENATAGTG